MKVNIFGFRSQQCVFILIFVAILMANTETCSGKSTKKSAEEKSPDMDRNQQTTLDRYRPVHGDTTKDLEAKQQDIDGFLMAKEFARRTKRSSNPSLYKKKIPNGLRKAGKGLFYPAAEDGHSADKERERLRQVREHRKQQKQGEKKKAENSKGSSSSD